MEEIICYCRNVTKKEILIAMMRGARSLNDIQVATGACTGEQCDMMNPKGRCCATEILALLKDLDNRQTNHCSCCS
jgi:NAD(P)H-nitrite reductase large subunit